MSIKESSIKLLKILRSLSKVDQIFFKPNLSKGTHDSITVDLENVSDVNAIDLISQTILTFSKSDILKYEKAENVTIDYSRDFGFSFVLTYENAIAFNVVVGSSNAGGIATLSIKRYFDFNEYFNVLKALVNEADALRGAVSISELSFNRICRSFKAPLGWITYFSNNCDVSIPNNLDDVEYQYTDKGKYLILTRSDITTDPESYELSKTRLLNIMTEIKQKVPSYGKEFPQDPISPL